MYTALALTLDMISPGSLSLACQGRVALLLGQDLGKKQSPAIGGGYRGEELTGKPNLSGGMPPPSSLLGGTYGGIAVATMVLLPSPA